LGGGRRAGSNQAKGREIAGHLHETAYSKLLKIVRVLQAVSAATRGGSMNLLRVREASFNINEASVRFGLKADIPLV
jgi:hypothetical protein